MIVPRVILEKIWERKRHTRRGQVEMCLFLGFVFGLTGALSINGLSADERFWFALISSVVVGVMAVLVAVVSSVYLEFIESKKATGRSLLVHQLALGIYWLVVLPVVLVCLIVLVMETLDLWR